MKKLLILPVVLLSYTTIKAQLAVSSIQKNQNELVINDSISLKKGDSIKIYLPVGKDFVFVKQKKSGLNAKLLGSVADVVGVGASVVGVNSGSFKTISNASKVLNTTNTIRYGANAIEQIQNLPISNNAKKIAGQKMEIIDWTFTDDGYILSLIHI